MKSALLDHHKGITIGWSKKRKELKQLPYVVSIICRYCITRDEVAGYTVGVEAIQMIGLNEMNLEKFGEFVKTMGMRDLELLGDKLKEHCPWIYSRLEGLYQYRTYEQAITNMIRDKIDQMVEYVAEMALRLVNGEKRVESKRVIVNGDIFDDLTGIALSQPLIPTEERSSDLLDFKFDSVRRCYGVVHQTIR
jgi:hypothetical protein